MDDLNSNEMNYNKAYFWWLPGEYGSDLQTPEASPARDVSD